jgi:rhodanese-related sulfurtransferase
MFARRASCAIVVVDGIDFSTSRPIAGDVHESLKAADPGFVLLDVRGPAMYAAGHVDRAVNLPHGKINERNLAAYPAETRFVVYCNGPHCNGADKAALRLARLGRPVKKMIGGVEGWKDEGFPLQGPK